MRSEQEVISAIDKYADTVQRICILHLKNYADTEDIFQTVFIKYALKSPEFISDDHEKAWIIRVTINACKDLLKSFFKSHTTSFEEVVEEPVCDQEDYSDVLSAVQSLPEKYRIVVYLYYYEGYTALEIGKLLGKNVNTIYTRLNRSKQIMKEKLRGDGYEK